MHRYILILFITILSLGFPARAQIVNTVEKEKLEADSIRRALDNGPYFTLYKDNYFIAGTTIGGKPTATNSDVKFQVSIAQRLTKSTLPFNTYLYLFYTQKCMWNVFENSMPMRDFNFNPGIGLAKHLFVKNRYVGKVTLMIEHESNGRDGIESRSWNKVSLASNIFIDPNFMVHGKVWIPIIDGQNNQDILYYSGIYQVGTTFTTPNKRFGFALTMVKRKGWNFKYNTIWEVNYRLFKDENQFLFLQYYNGYGENLLDYNQYHSRLRIGLVIKPQLFSEF
jgi:phospholipase A1